MKGGISVSNHEFFRQVWGYTPVDYRTWPAKAVPQIQQLTLHADFATDQLQVVLTNQNGVMPLQLTSMTVSCYRAGARCWEQPLTVHERDDLVLDLDQTVLSDPVVGAIQRSDSIVIRLILPRLTYLSSGVVTYSQLNFAVEQRQLMDHQVIAQRDQFIMVRNNPRMVYFFGVCGIFMHISTSKHVVSVFGDSIIQQGFFANRLRESLYLSASSKYGVVNCGIGGNRVLYPTDPAMDQWYRHGIAGVDRFEQDVFGLDTPDTVIILHGINDLIQQKMHPGEEEAVADVIRGLQTYSTICQRRHTPALIGTLMPLGTSQFYSQAVEEKRQALNHWIRNQQEFSGVIDFDQALCDPQRPEQLRSAADSMDGLHPGDAGGLLMAEAAHHVLAQLDIERNQE